MNILRTRLFRGSYIMPTFRHYDKDGKWVPYRVNRVRVRAGLDGLWCGLVIGFVIGWLFGYAMLDWIVPPIKAWLDW